MPDYSLFGLRVRSERPLPELPPAMGQEEPDVTVRFGAIDSDCREAGLHRLDDAMLFIAPDAARYRVSQGRDILVEPIENAHDRNVRLYLLGSAFGALVHQRGLLPLHANAVEIDGRAFAFIGAQGEGKSTLAAWFHDQGHRIIADDICVIDFVEGVPVAMPGLPRLRLWEDALASSGRDFRAFDRSFVGDDAWNKYDVPINFDRLTREPLPFAAAYLLESGDEFAARHLQGLEAARAIFEHTYRGGYVDAANGQKSHWEAAVRLVQKAPIFRLNRKRGFERFDLQAHKIRDHAKSVPNE